MLRPRSAPRLVVVLAGLLGAAVAASAQAPLAERLVFNTLAPCRLADTRLAAAGALAAGEVRTFHVVGSAADFAAQGGTAGGCGIPGFAGIVARAQAVAFNVVAVSPSGAGNLRAWPTGQAVPNSSILNYAQMAGLNLANGIALPVRQDVEGSDLTIRADGSGTHVVIDVVGYYRLVTQLDGAGSGIDADLLDGLDAAAFAAVVHDHDARYWKRGGNAGTNATDFLGTTDGQPLEFRVDDTRALRLEPTGGLPNVIGGGSTNLASPGVTGAVIGGGNANSLFDSLSFIGGGGSNRVNLLSVVGGGIANWATGQQSSILGGFSNNAAAEHTVIGGGGDNQAVAQAAAVLGGRGNTASGVHSVVGGGNANEALGVGAAVFGGVDNRAGGDLAVVPGGTGNRAFAARTFAGGTRAMAMHLGTFVWADATAADLVSTGPAQFIVRAAGGIWLGTDSAVDIPAGRFLNTSTGGYLTSGGAWTNSSDAALKQDFEPVDGAAVLEAVARLPIASWRYRAEDEDARHLGPTAQDFHAAFGLGGDRRAITTVDADGVALAAIQELERRTREVALLKQELQELRRVVDELRARR